MLRWAQIHDAAEATSLRTYTVFMRSRQLGKEKQRLSG